MKTYYTLRILLADLAGFVVYFTLYSLFTWYHHELKFIDVFIQAVFFTVTMSLFNYWIHRRKEKKNRENLSA